MKVILKGMKFNHNLFAWLKKQRAAMFWGGLGAVILVGLSLYAVSAVTSDSVVRRTALHDVPTLDIKIEAVPAQLSGELTDKIDATRNVLGVMVENSPDARPQSGLDDAEVVFEAIAEGGITRFVTFFQAHQPNKIGPIRSVRPHYVDWVLGFDASIAHAGGSAQGLADLRTYHAKDLDEFANGAYYYRDSLRYAPHNLYSSYEELNRLQELKGYKSSNFHHWKFEDGSPADQITAQKIDIQISSALYNVSYEYDRDINEYVRSVGGVQHIDANTGQPITVDNVIVMEVPYHLEGIYYMYDLTGSGNAHLFRNGKYTKIKWQRSSETSSFIFKLNGKEITLNRGQTWVTAIAPGNDLTVRAAVDGQ